MYESLVGIWYNCTVHKSRKFNNPFRWNNMINGQCLLQSFHNSLPFLHSPFFMPWFSVQRLIETHAHIWYPIPFSIFYRLIFNSFYMQQMQYERPLNTVLSSIASKRSNAYFHAVFRSLGYKILIRYFIYVFM